MTVVKILSFAVGAGAVAFIVMIAIRTVVLPRAATDPPTRTVFTTSYPTFSRWSNRKTMFEGRDKAFAFYSPMTLLFLPLVWLTVLLFGYMAMFWAVGVEGARRAFTVNGSSLVTLGFAPVECALTLAPYAPWSSDRSLATWDRTPTIMRWAQRLRDRT